MNRKRALAVIYAAGYHDDQRAFIRTYVENRISYGAAMREFVDGKAARARGLRCTCSECKPAEATATTERKSNAPQA